MTEYSRSLIALFICIALLAVSTAYSQGSAGTGGDIEPRYIIDMPTAGLLARGSYAIDMDFFQRGGMMMRINVGVLPSLSFGISYGANNVVGSEKVEPNPLPGINVRLRLMDETTASPALLAGFDSQGKEMYHEGLDRYTIKSPGFFLAASKNYRLLGHLSIHGGVNYSLETGDGNKGLNIYTGMEKSFGPDLSLLLEYNLGLNDSRSEAIGRGRGYLNTGIRWSFGRGVTLGFDLKDIIKNNGHRERNSIGNRTVYIEYVSFL